MAGPGRVDLPLHGDRHHRRRRFGDPEEHHRPAQTRPPEELLIGGRFRDPASFTERTVTARPPVPPGLLAGWSCSTCRRVGPAARCTRLLADYGATVVKVGPVPGRGPRRSPRRSSPTAPRVACDGSAIDLKDPDGRDAFLAWSRGPTWWWRASGPGSSIGWASATTPLTRRQPRGSSCCSTTGFGQDGPRAEWAGHDLNYLAVGGYLASTEPRADGGPPDPRRHHRPMPPAAACRPPWPIMAALVGRGRTDGRGPTSTSPSPTGCCG